MPAEPKKKIDPVVITGSRAEMAALYYNTLVRSSVPPEHACELTKAYISEFFAAADRYAESKLKS